MKTIAVKGELREELGKKANNALRREGRVPAVLYGGDDVVHFSTTPLDIRDLIYTGEFRIAEIEVDGKKERAFVKGVQFHPVTEDILHVDFLRLIKGVPVKINVPISFEGIPEGVRNGGRLVKILRRVQIKVLPENLISELVADVTPLTMGDTLRIRDMQSEESVELLVAPSVPIATVQVPRALRSATAAAEEGEEGLEGEEGEEVAEGGEGEGTEE